MSKRQTRNGRATEKSMGMMPMLGFEVFDWKTYSTASRSALPARVMVENARYITPFGTVGRREYLLDALDARSNFDLPFTDEVPSNGRLRCYVECKVQHDSGSTDEKLALIPEQLMASDVPYMILIYDGKHWESERGRAIIEWMKNKAYGLRTIRRFLLICTIDEYAKRAKQLFPR